MKLYESGAVLLIIGAVVIGPIDDQCAETKLPNGWKCDLEWPRSYENKIGCQWNGVTGDKQDIQNYAAYCVRRETIAETCARAMREIGATERSPDSGRPWEPNLDGFILGDQRVLCIPAPTGLRR